MEKLNNRKYKTKSQRENGRGWKKKLLDVQSSFFSGSAFISSGSTDHLCLINTKPSQSLVGNKSLVSNPSALFLINFNIFVFICNV